MYPNPSVNRDSLVRTATFYGLDGPGIESRWWVRFSALVHTDPGAHSASPSMSTGSLQMVYRRGRGLTIRPHLAPKLKKEYSCTSTPPLVLYGLF